MRSGDFHASDAMSNASAAAHNAAANPSGARATRRALVTTRGAALHAMRAPLFSSARINATSSLVASAMKPPARR